VDNLLVYHESEGSYGVVQNPLTLERKRRNRQHFFDVWGPDHEACVAAYDQLNALGVKRDRDLGICLFRPTESYYDLLFVLPGILDKIGGIWSVMQLVKRLISLGVRAQVYTEGPVSREFLERHRDFAPITQQDSGVRISGVRIVCATSFDTVPNARELAGRYGAALEYFVQGPEAMFLSGTQFGMATEDYHTFQRVLVTSSFLADYVRLYGDQISDACLIRLGPDNLRYYPRNVERKPLSIVGCLRAIPEKGTSLLLYFLSLAKQRGFTVHLFGADTSRFDIPSEFAIQHGDISGEAAATLFSAAGFYADFSIYEGLGLVPLEAAFCGAIPILLNNGGVNTVFTPGESAVFASGVAGLATACDEALAIAGDPARADAMRSNGIAIGEKHSLRLAVQDLYRYLESHGIRPWESRRLSFEAVPSKSVDAGEVASIGV
jgi:glycosyltransferase involved in cell wall biosynthesis